MRRLLILIGLLLPLAVAAAEPLQPRADEAPSSGLLATIGRTVLDFQREANQEIGRQMRAVRDGETTGALVSAMLLAFVYGIVHAAGPGHGKLVVMSYFVGRDARIGRGLLMGAQIAVMHVVSAVVIVSLADLLLRRSFGGVPAEVPAVRLVSYVMILAIGALMLWRAVRHARAGHRHDASCGCGARHEETGILSLGVGLVPCTGAVLILLYAFANGILWAGLAMVTAIAVGMALTMGGLGLASVMVRRHLVLRSGGARAVAVVDIAGAGLIVLVGAALLVTAV